MGIINNKSLDLVNRDKDSSVGIMINQITVADFIEWLNNGVYTSTNDITLEGLKLFQSFGTN